jgi:hypothetical protein
MIAPGFPLRIPHKFAYISNISVTVSTPSTLKLRAVSTGPQPESAEKVAKKRELHQCIALNLGNVTIAVLRVRPMTTGLVVPEPTPWACHSVFNKQLL